MKPLAEAQLTFGMNMNMRMTAVEVEIPSEYEAPTTFK